MANEIEIPLKLSGVQSLKAELVSLKAGIADASDPEQMAALAAKAGEVSEKIKDANEQLAEMSKGSSLGKVSEAFHDIKEDINSIDFAGATKQMDKFSEASAESAKSLDKGATFAQRYGEELQPLTTRLGEAEDRLYELALAGEKTSQEYQDLLDTVSRYRRVQIETDQVVDGASQTMAQKLGGSLGGVTSAFELAQGAAGAFGASGEAIEKSLLKVQSAAAIAQGFQGIKEAIPSIKALGASFKGLGVTIISNPIFLLAAVITAILVAIGIFLKKIGVLDKIFNAINAALKPLIDGFKQLTEWLGLSTAASDDAAEKVKANNEKIVASSKERAEAQSKSIEQEIQLAQSLGKETTDLEIEKTKVTERESKKRLKQTEKDLKELKDKRGTLAEEERARLKKQLKEENALIRQAQVDRKVILNKAAKEDADEAKEKAAKDAEDAKKRAEDAAKAYREGRTAIQKEIAAANKLVVDSGKTQQQKEIDDVKAKYDALIKEAKKYKQDTTALKAAEKLEIDAINKAAADAELEIQKNLAKQLADFRNEELDRAEAIQEQAYQSGLTARQKEIEERTYYYDNLIAEANRYGVDTKVFEEQRRKELADINKKFDDQDKQVALEKIAQEQAIRDAKIEIASSVAQGLGAIGEAFIKDQEKLEKFNKAQALIQIGIDTAKAISSLVAMSQANPLNSVTAGAAGLAQYAAGIVQIVTNIAKAKSILMNPTNTSAASAGGGGGTSSSASASSSVPSFVPGNLFGQGNAANNVTAPTGMESGQNITVTAVVSETEITATQNKVNKIMKNSVL